VLFYASSIQSTYVISLRVLWLNATIHIYGEVPKWWRGRTRKLINDWLIEVVWGNEPRWCYNVLKEFFLKFAKFPNNKTITSFPATLSLPTALNVRQLYMEGYRSGHNELDSKRHSQLLSHAPANPSKSGGSERSQDRRPKKSLTFR
jgi:hypothetical protein